MNTITKLQSVGRAVRYANVSAINTKTNTPVVLKFNKALYDKMQLSLARSRHSYGKRILMEESYDTNDLKGMI